MAANVAKCGARAMGHQSRYNCECSAPLALEPLTARRHQLCVELLPLQQVRVTRVLHKRQRVGPDCGSVLRNFVFAAGAGCIWQRLPLAPVCACVLACMSLRLHFANDRIVLVLDACSMLREASAAALHLGMCLERHHARSMPTIRAIGAHARGL